MLIVLYAFDPVDGGELADLRASRSHWFSVAWHDPQVRAAFLLSVKVGLLATGIALVLGSAVAYALHSSSSSAATRSRSCSCCRSRCPASSPASP